MKKINFISICILFLIAFSFNACATEQSTQQFSKLFLSPFYVPSTTANTNINFSVSVNPPDKIRQVLSAVINFDIWLNPSVNFTLLVNGNKCNNPEYYISTTYASAGKNLISFDCSNVITSSGTYFVQLKSNKDTGAMTGWLDFTYLNNPRGELTLHGTEYTFGQMGKVWLQLVDNNGDYVNEGVCYADVYTPDGEELVEKVVMNNMNHDGIYYYDIFIEEDMGEGVFPAIARCYYIAEQFSHPANRYILVNATLTSGTIADTQTDNAVTLKLKEINVGGIRTIKTDFEFDLTNCTTIDELLFTSVSFYIDAKFDSTANDDITILVYNYSSSSFIELPNKLLEGNIFRQVSNSLDMANLTTSGLINGSNTLTLRLQDNSSFIDGGADDIEIDYLYTSCDQLSSPEWQSLAGSSELHVSAPLNTSQLIEQIWNYSNRSLTSFDFVVNANISATEVAEAVWTYSGDRNLTFYEVNNITPADIWNYTSRELTNYNHTDLTNYSRISMEVWNYTSRELTNFDFLVNIGFNLSDISEEVWNYEGDRNLTFYEVTQINNTEVALEVWQFSNRSLTFYEVNNLTAQEIWAYQNRSLTETDNIASSIWSWTGGVSSSLLNFFSTDIWNYSSRVLTAFDFDVVNETQIAEYVWSSPTRNLTFYEVNNIAPEDIFDYFGNNSAFIDRTNYTLIGETTWTWVDRNLTMYPIGNNITAEDIWTYYNRSLSENIPLQIWNYPERNLTTDIPFQVWSYENRTLTYYTINLTELIEMISNYNYTEFPIPITPSEQQNQYSSPYLNVILYVPK